MGIFSSLSKATGTNTAQKDRQTTAVQAPAPAQTVQMPARQASGGMFGRVSSYLASGTQTNNLGNLFSHKPAEISPELQQTTRGTLASIQQMNQTNPTKARSAMDMLKQLQSDPSSRYFNPYKKATNRAVDALAELGFDVSNIDDNWFDQNAWLKQYFVPTANTNSLSTTMTGKKSTPKQQAAYYYNQLDRTRADTQAAQSEREKLNKYVSYWAAQKDRNYSDDEILGMIGWKDGSPTEKFKKDYPTLYKMEMTRRQGTPMELNSAVDFSLDGLYGTMWAARNGGSTGNPYQDMINSVTENNYTDNAEIRAKRTRASSGYAPYSLGSTMDKERALFGQDSFTREWVSRNMGILDTGTDEEKEAFISVMDAMDKTEKADKELDKLKKYLDRKIASSDNPEEVISKLDNQLTSGEYPTLVEMDRDMSKGNERLMKTTWAVDYSRGTMEQYIRDSFANKPQEKNGEETVNAFNALPPVDPKDVVFVPAGKPGDIAPSWQNRVATRNVQEPKNDPIGQFGRGNIDLNNRPVVVNPDGTVSTEKSFSVGIDGKEVLLPTIINGKEVSEDEAIRHYEETGEYLGKFDTVEEADAYAEQLHQRQEQRYGTGAKISKENIVASAGPTTTVPPETRAALQPGMAARAKTDTVLNKKIQDAVDALASGMTDAEKKHIEDNPGIEFSRTVLNMGMGPLNPAMWQDPNWAYNNTERLRKQAEDNYVNTSFETAAIRTRYENIQKQLQAGEAKEEQIRSQYGQRMLANEQIPESVDVTLNDSIPYELQDITLDYNPKTGEYELYGEITPYTENVLAANDMTVEQYLAAVNEKAQALNERAAGIAAAKVKYGENPNLPTQEELDALTMENQRLRDTLYAMQPDYETAVSSLTAASNRRNRMADVMLRHGDAVPDPSKLDTMLKFAEGFTGYKNPPATPDTLINQIWSENTLENRSTDLSGMTAELDESIRDIKYDLDNLPGMPQEYRDAMQTCLDYLNNQKTQIDLVKYSQSEDFDKWVEKGKQIEADYVWNNEEGRPQIIGQRKELREFMTPTELDIYYALLGQYGVDRADAFYNSIEDSLELRPQQIIQENAAEQAETAGGRILNTAVGIGLAPLEVVTSVLDGLYTLVNGEGSTWLEMPGTLSKTAFNESIKGVENAYGPGLKSDIIKGIYEIAFNVGRSRMVAGTFGGLIPEVSGNDFVNSVTQAMPIATIAFNDTLQKALDDGVEPWKAGIMATVSFISESFTEGIELKRWKDALATGQNLTKNALVEFIKGYMPEAVSEVLGESLNDISEKMADYLLDENGEIRSLIREYEQGHTDEEAFDMMLRDQLADIMHTAAISFFSPGTEVANLAAGYIQSYSAYREQAKALQQSGQANMSIRDVRKATNDMIRADREFAKTIDEMILKRPLRGFYASEESKMASLREAWARAIRADNTAENRMNEYDFALSALEGAALSDKTTRTATIAAVLGTDETNAPRAAAAAVELSRILGNDASDTISQLMAGGITGDVNIKALKLGIQYAALGKGWCYNTMQNDTFKLLSPDQQAQLLAGAVIRDEQDAGVQKAVNDTVHDFRVNEEIKNMMASEEADDAVAAHDAANRASQTAREAEALHEEKQGDKEAAQNNLKAAEEEFQRDPQAGAPGMTNAINKLNSTTAVEEEYAQKEKASQEAEKAAKEKEKRLAETKMAALRQQAEARVAEKEAQEAQYAAEMEALERQKDIEAKALTEAEEFRDNAAGADVEDFIARTNPDATEEEKAHIREVFLETQRRMTEEQQAASQNMAPQEQMAADIQQRAEERTKFLNQVANKFSLNGITEVDPDNETDPERVAMVEELNGGNGYYDSKTNTIVLNKKASVGDAMYFVLGHELTHVTEAAGEYKQMADRLLGLFYGKGTTYQGVLNEIEAGSWKSPLARQVLEKKKTYDRVKGGNHSAEYCLQEVVADCTGRLLRRDAQHPEAQQNLINQLVAEEPTIARKILDTIKSFLKKLVGARGAWQSELQQTVQMFETALQNAQDVRLNNQTRPQGTDFRSAIEGAGLSIKTGFSRAFEDYSSVDYVYDSNGHEIGEIFGNAIKGAKDNKTLLNLGFTEKAYTKKESLYTYNADLGTTKHLLDRQGNETAAEEFRGGTVAVDTTKYSLNSFNESEQARTRQALLNVRGADGKRLYTPEQVDKYMSDALSIASVIAGNRARLDFEATDNPLMTFLKKNQDYGFTLDASTLCAKRLLYQGTFNYVQHALPDEVFTPEDLVDLVNIMNEMGYETPCGICYVESRRRWLDTYANEFITKTLEDPEPFIEKQFKKASNEEKDALRERLAGEKPSIDDLTTTDGLEKLRKNDPLMYKAFVAAMNAKGSANPKIVQPRAEYKGEISRLTKKQIQSLKDIGGLRVQSFSDFETPHLLDMVQAVMDMSARGLTSQAYTKVPNFAWVFGDTGIKINLSLIGKGTGLDDNGNLIFDNKEGINFDEAMRLRERYSKNVGTIIVGINDDHIVAAMGDPRIDFIIPFHKSGWSDLERKGIKSLQYYEDYTDTQSERKLYKDKDGKIVRNKDGSYKTVPAKESKLVNFEPVGAHKYWEFNHDGEWNARKYLKMCAEDGRIPKFNQFLVDNGDGSFSLPEGDDKRSKAIREGYWKTLIDFKMYDNDGVGADQQEVTPNINMNQAQRVLNEYTLRRPSGNPDTRMVDMKNNNDVPVATTAGDEFIRRIQEKRRGKTPTPPNKPLEATPEIDVTKLGRNQFADEALANPVNGTAAMASGAEADLGNTPSEYEYEDAIHTAQRMAIDAETGENIRYSLPVSDPDTLDFLNKQEESGDVIRTYRTMKVLNGKLTSPKATLINGSVEAYSELGQWEKATEHPELIRFEKGKPKFILDEGKMANGKTKTIPAAYNPYMHSSNLMLNDQFSVAYKYSGDDPNLGQFVTVECIVPKSEATSGYKAQYAKDPVGWTNWKAGGVAQQLEKAGGEKRNVFLSRWIKPIRIVPDSEVAEHYKKLLDGKNIAVPANVVPPSLLKALEEAGVKIGPPQKQYADQYRETMGTKYSLPSDAPNTASVERGETVRNSLGDIDSVYDDMSLAELQELLGVTDEEEARQVITESVQDLKDEFDPSIYNGRLYVKPETLDHWLSGSGFASSNPNYAQAYITTMDPADFLRMTTARPESQRRVLDEATPLDEERLSENAERQPIQLLIDEDAGKVTGHEGRHRAIALARAGVKEMPVLLFDSATKYSKTEKPEMTLRGQNPAFDDSVENGNELTFRDVIPLSSGNADTIRQRFTASAEDEAAAARNGQRVIRYSLPSDAPYMAAVERGEMDQAQQMVDEKAREAGYTEKVYHGTRNFGFTEFDTSLRDEKSNQYIFVAHSRKLAGTYTQNGTVRDIYSSPGTSEDVRSALEGMPDDEFLEAAQNLIEDIPESKGVTLHLNDDGTFTLDRGDPNKRNTIMSRERLTTMLTSGAAYNGIYQLYAKPGKQLTVDAKGARWSEISVPWSDTPVKTDDIAEYAKENGYDSVRINNVHDTGKGTGAFDQDAAIGDISAYFNKDDVKSADTITYDDQGNVIPLSERFRTDNNDIRYSIPDDTVLEQQIREYLRNGGSLNRPTTPAPDTPQRQRQWGSARAERSPVLHDETIQYLRENGAYNPDSNQAQVNRAFDWIQSHANESDGTGYYGAVTEIESPDFDYRSADGQARMMVVMGMAALQGDTATEVRLADAYNRQGTDLGQALQARKIFQMMTPAGRIAALEREAGRINENYKKQGKKNRVGLSDETLEAAGNARTPEDFDKVRKRAAQELAAQMPPNWKDRLNALRMLAMLGNTRTHIRNVLGNAIFMPVVGIKNKVGAATEILSRQETRTKTLGLASADARAFAKADTKEMEAVLRGEAKYKEGNQVERERKAFGNGGRTAVGNAVSRTLGKFTQMLIDANGNALEFEDWIFLSRHYRNALAGYMTANKLKASDMTGKTLDDARAYAVQEAQKATYRDANKVIEGLNKWEQSHPGVKFLGNAVLPFKKTPANILKRGVEYSPVGLINALTRGARQVKLWNDYQNGKLDALPEKAISPTQFIDKIAAGLTGTAITALGAALASIGAASVGFNDDDDEFEKLQGEQEYALNLKLFGQDVSFTADWAAPVCMPFFVGAALWDTYKNAGDASITGVLHDLMSITEPVWNLSMLDGVNSLLDVNQYAEGNAFTQIGEKVLANYITSYIPSAVGAYTRTADPTRRKAFVESGAELSTFRYMIEQIENKLPWLSYTNIPYRDVWGNAETSSHGEALIENFISPGYANQIKNDPVVNELERIYHAEGVTDENRRAVVPKAASKTISNVKLNDKQYDQYVVSRGQTARQVLEGLMESPFWGISDDNTRAKMVSDAWTYANQVSQHEVTGRKLDSWVLEASTTGNAVQSIVSRTADSNRSAYIKEYGLQLAQAADENEPETYATCLAALESAEATNVEIRSSLRNYFKPLYQSAYVAGDETRMDEIKEILIDTDLGFKSTDFNSWIPNEDETEFENQQWLTTH